ncbi:MerR family transcriptional regulator [Nonomuraea endophytica]|uniref:MerR family transcriptional regulator n=1 Tax=Nonomuraea endophytica TaxID=714136 RepID=UPI0037C58B05
MSTQNAPAEEPGYGIGAVARRLGVPAPTLRTWNLRYGIGPSRRSPGGHRRYGQADLRRLEEMNRLIHHGVAPADAAREALGLRLDDASPVAKVPPSPQPPSPQPPSPQPPSPRLPEVAVPSADMLARAAAVLNGRALDEGLTAGLTRYGVVWTWQRLVLPVFETISTGQERTGAGIEVEHVFSDRVMAALQPLIARPSKPVNARLALLACAEDEQHSLPLYALAAALATRCRVESRVLGARTPPAALAGAVRTLSPGVVFVWSQQWATGDPEPLGALPALRPPYRLMVGGPGWRGELPRAAVRVGSLKDAVRRITAALT